MGRIEELGDLRRFTERLGRRVAAGGEHDLASVGELTEAMELVCAALSAIERAGAGPVDLRDASGSSDPLFSVTSRLFARPEAEAAGTIATRLRRIADEIESLEARRPGDIGPGSPASRRDPA